MNESLEAIAMVQGHSGQRINLYPYILRFFQRTFESCREFHMSDWELNIPQLNGCGHGDSALFG